MKGTSKMTKGIFTILLGCVTAVVVFALVLWGTTAAQEIHSPHCLYGCPSGTPVTNNLIIREIYAMSSNDSTKFADWVAYKVTEDTIGPTTQRKWRADPLLDENETLEPDDYKDAHATLKTDRGHQVPLASFTGTEHWKDTNYLSNITPQKSALNQGPWLRLESKVRELARQRNVYVMTGPVYLREMPSLPRADESHTIPSGYWKLVAIENGNGIKVAGFFFKQETERGANVCDHLTAVDEIEEKSELDFYWHLEDEQEGRIESSQHGGTLAQEHFGCSPS